jgi:catechol 2,3-dioxygenase-like lactoylglutathione lyase family enzyme
MTAQLLSIARFNLVTTDLRRLVAFYRDVLRLAPCGDEQPIEHAEMALLGLTGAGRRQMFTVGRQCLAIDEFAPPSRSYPDGGSAASLWFQHLALTVNDIAAAHARLTGADPISAGGPQLLPPASGSVWAFKFRDPDGHPLEFLQKPGQPSHPRAELIAGIDHSAISVADADASSAFYGDLGLKPGTRTLNRGPEQDRLDGLSGVEVDVVAMIPPRPAPHLELLGYRRPGGARGPTSRVDDVAATRIVWRGGHAGLLRDPDGHLHQVEAEPSP